MHSDSSVRGNVRTNNNTSTANCFVRFFSSSPRGFTLRPSAFGAPDPNAPERQQILSLKRAVRKFFNPF
jgi:hypothetical protein